MPEFWEAIRKHSAATGYYRISDTNEYWMRTNTVSVNKSDSNAYLIRTNTGYHQIPDKKEYWIVDTNYAYQMNTRYKRIPDTNEFRSI